jgi:superfamily I DNA and/or RNA helicase
MSLDPKSGLLYRGWLNFLEQSRSRPYCDLIKAQVENQIGHENAANVFEYLVYRTLCDLALQDNNILDDRSLLSLDQIKVKFQELDREVIKLQCKELAYQLHKVKPSEGISTGYVSSYTEMGLIRHQVQGKARQIPLRRFVEKSGKALQTLKPCFLMSPLSVAQYISPHGIKFDLVVIDEASQMCPEDALGAIARCAQIVVVGDPQQLPPTAFFQKQLSESSDDYEEEDRLDNESILDMSYSRYFPPRELLWHYRSRHESLIAFSNAQFYDGRLIVFPSPENNSDKFGVSSRYVGGIYSASCNVDEAKAVVNAARQFMRDHPEKSLGIATMNSQQRDLIDEEIYRLFLGSNLNLTF